MTHRLRTAAVGAAVATMLFAGAASAQDFSKTPPIADSIAGVTSTKSNTVQLPFRIAYGAIKLEAKMNDKAFGVTLDTRAMKEQCIVDSGLARFLGLADSVDLELAGVRKRVAVELGEPGSGFVLGMEFLKSFKSVRIDFGTKQIELSQEGDGMREWDRVLKKTPFDLGTGINSLGWVVLRKDIYPEGLDNQSLLDFLPGAIYAVSSSPGDIANRILENYVGFGERLFIGYMPLPARDRRVTIKHSWVVKPSGGQNGNPDFANGKNAVKEMLIHAFWLFPGFTFFDQARQALVLDLANNEIVIIKSRNEGGDVTDMPDPSALFKKREPQTDKRGPSTLLP